MARVSANLLFVACLLGGFVLPAQAQSVSTVYDMSRMLNEPHPFAAQMGSQWRPLAPTAVPFATPVAAPGSARPSVRPAATRQSAPAQPQSSPMEDVSAPYQWFSEIRVGALKHAVSMIGNTTKETGIDANLEVLFGSPGWLDWAWSPRPHLGASFNTSSTNTDIVYSGLTWEWKPWKELFIDFSFGFAVHNGKLAYDAAVAFPQNANRHREFGCRALFRESLEAGWIFAKRHAVSLMWAHYSHGGLCADQNEGLDNAGVRYGYRF